jgi:hypothetical protein
MTDAGPKSVAGFGAVPVVPVGAGLPGMPPTGASCTIFDDSLTLSIT